MAGYVARLSGLHLKAVYVCVTGLKMEESRKGGAGQFDKTFKKKYRKLLFSGAKMLSSSCKTHPKKSPTNSVHQRILFAHLFKDPGVVGGLTAAKAAKKPGLVSRER